MAFILKLGFDFCYRTMMLPKTIDNSVVKILILVLKFQLGKDKRWRYWTVINSIWRIICDVCLCIFNIFNLSWSDKKIVKLRLFVWYAGLYVLSLKLWVCLDQGSVYCVYYETVIWIYRNMNKIVCIYIKKSKNWQQVVITDRNIYII